MFRPMVNFMKRVLGGERKQPAKPEPHREKVEIPMPASPSLFGMVTPEYQEKYDATSPYFGLFVRGDYVKVFGIGKRTYGKIVGCGEVLAIHPTKGVLLHSGWRQPNRMALA